jgi:predicted metal-dependent hydrolase
MPDDLDHRLFAESVEHFNAGRYFEAHESWEDDWRHRAHRSEDWHFLKGLICLAVALHHHANANERGRGMLLRRALDSLEAVTYPDTWVNLDELRDWARRALADPQIIEHEVPRVVYVPPP